MDPVGFGLERYDAIGRYRTVDDEGRALTGEGELVGADEPGFVDGRELAVRIRSHPDLSPCITRQVFRYLMARG